MAVDQWEVVRHQAAIAGRITDAQTEVEIGNALVEIVDGPPEFKEWLAIKKLQYGERWAYLSKRPGQTRTRADGHFHFLDLPSGGYTLKASIPALGTRYATASTTTTVTRDANGNVTMGKADMEIAPTTLWGRVTGPDSEGETKNILMAEVRVKGSAERAFSNEQGRYLLTALEPGTREIAVFALGHETITRTVTLSGQGAVSEENFDLVLQS